MRVSVILIYIVLAALEGLVDDNDLLFPNLLLLAFFFIECIFKFLGY